MLEKHDGFLEGLKDHTENYAPPKDEYFVQIADGNFILGDKKGVLLKDKTCHKLYLSGTNKYELVEAGAGTPFLFDGQLVEPGITGPEVVRRVLSDAERQGLDFIRFNAFAVDSQ